MAFSTDAQETIGKLRRRIFDTNSRYTDAELWAYICDAVTEANIRTEETVETTAEGFSVSLSLGQKNLYAGIARVLMGFGIGMIYSDGQARIQDAPLRSQEQVIAELVNAYYGEIISVEDSSELISRED
jgi:hypothetical protein